MEARDPCGSSLVQPWPKDSVILRDSEPSRQGLGDTPR